MTCDSITLEELLGPTDAIERKNAPDRLYYAGDLEILRVSACVSVVGSRKVSELGVKRARKLVRALAAADVLGDFFGTLVADGFGVYGSFAKKAGRFTLGHYWVHARRKYFHAQKFFPVAEEMVALIGKLYNIGREVSGSPYDTERLERLRHLRQTKSKPVVAEIEDWMMSHPTLPGSMLGKAKSYMQKMWLGLLVFLDDPRVPLDTNSVERSLRGVVAGRKNHLGSKSRRGTEVAATLYSLIESAKLCDLEPRAYLKSAAVAAIEDRPVPLPHEYAGLEIG